MHAENCTTAQISVYDLIEHQAFILPYIQPCIHSFMDLSPSSCRMPCADSTSSAPQWSRVLHHHPPMRLRETGFSWIAVTDTAPRSPWVPSYGLLLHCGCAWMIESECSHPCRDWSSMTINGVDATHAVGDWYVQATVCVTQVMSRLLCHYRYFNYTSAHKFVDCEFSTTEPYVCNPTCHQ